MQYLGLPEQQEITQLTPLVYPRKRTVCERKADAPVAAPGNFRTLANARAAKPFPTTRTAALGSDEPIRWD